MLEAEVGVGDNKPWKSFGKSTVRIKDLDKLNLLRFKARAIFHYCPRCLKNDAHFKSGENPVPVHP